MVMIPWELGGLRIHVVVENCGASIIPHSLFPTPFSWNTDRIVCCEDPNTNIIITIIQLTWKLLFFWMHCMIFFWLLAFVCWKTNIYAPHMLVEYKLGIYWMATATEGRTTTIYAMWCGVIRVRWWPSIVGRTFNKYNCRVMWNKWYVSVYYSSTYVFGHFLYWCRM